MKAGYLQLKDHVQHSIRAEGFQQLHDVGVFKHVTDAGLPLQVWKESTRKAEERVKERLKSQNTVMFLRTMFTFKCMSLKLQTRRLRD